MSEKIDCYLGSLVEMVADLSKNDGAIQGIVLLARVVDDEKESIYIGMSQDITDDPSRVLGHLELTKSKLLEMISPGTTTH